MRRLQTGTTGLKNISGLGIYKGKTKILADKLWQIGTKSAISFVKSNCLIFTLGFVLYSIHSWKGRQTHIVSQEYLAGVKLRNVGELSMIRQTKLYF